MTSTAPIAMPTAQQGFALPRPHAGIAGSRQVGPTQGPKSQSAAQGHGVDLRPNRLLRGDNMLQAQRSADGAQGDGLSDEEKAELKAMKERDAEVKRHEQAHARVGGRHAGAPQYQYETGPDDRRYAVSGSVSIDVSPVAGKPKETIRKMDIVKRAALAPEDPSAQDRAVAVRAQQEKLQAQRELAEQKRDEVGAVAAGEPQTPGAAGTDYAPSTAGATRSPATAGLVDALA